MHLRDLNLVLEGNTKMTTITCVETMRNPHNPWNPPPVTFLFKDEGSLATHPQRCLATQKVRENERNWEKRENSHPRNILMIHVFTKSCLGLIYCPGQGKLQKCVNYPLLHEGNSRNKIQKSVKWVKKRGEPVSQCC